MSLSVQYRKLEMRPVYVMSRRRLRRCLEEWQVQARLHAVRRQRAAQAAQLRRRHLMETGFVSWWVCVPGLVWTLPGCCLNVTAAPAEDGLLWLVDGCWKCLFRHWQVRLCAPGAPPGLVTILHRNQISSSPLLAMQSGSLLSALCI